MERVLLLSADPWTMTDERTGEEITGVSFWFVSDYRKGENGLKPIKISGDKSLMVKCAGRLPCVAGIQFGLKPAAGNKAGLQLEDIHVFDGFNLADVLAEDAAL